MKGDIKMPEPKIIPDGFYWWKSSGNKPPTIIRISTHIMDNKKIKWVDFIGIDDSVRLENLKGYLEKIEHDEVFFHIHFVLGGD